MMKLLGIQLYHRVITFVCCSLVLTIGLLATIHVSADSPPRRDIIFLLDSSRSRVVLAVIGIMLLGNDYWFVAISGQEDSAGILATVLGSILIAASILFALLNILGKLTMTIVRGIMGLVLFSGFGSLLVNLASDIKNDMLAWFYVFIIIVSMVLWIPWESSR